MHTHTCTQENTHSPSCAPCSTSLCMSLLFTECKSHSCCQGQRDTKWKREKGEKTFDNGLSRHLSKRPQAAPVAASCWPRSWICRASPGDGVCPRETRGAGVKVVRTDRRWLTQHHRPFRIMTGFFQRWQWHLACKHPASLPRLGQMLLFLSLKLSMAKWFPPRMSSALPSLPAQLRGRRGQTQLTLHVWCHH